MLGTPPWDPESQDIPQEAQGAPPGVRASRGRRAACLEEEAGGPGGTADHAETGQTTFHRPNHISPSPRTATVFCRPGGAQDGATEPPRRPRGAGKARALHSTLSDCEVSGRACPLAQGGQRRGGALSPAVHTHVRVERTRCL